MLQLIGLVSTVFSLLTSAKNSAAQVEQSTAVEPTDASDGATLALQQQVEDTLSGIGPLTFVATDLQRILLIHLCRLDNKKRPRGPRLATLKIRVTGNPILRDLGIDNRLEQTLNQLVAAGDLMAKGSNQKRYSATPLGITRVSASRDFHTFGMPPRRHSPRDGRSD